MIEFTKMHGLGNDFVVIDNTDASCVFEPARISALADRHTGIGFDQLLVVEAPSDPDVEFDYRIFNADGGEVEHCGNGARCFARFVHDRGLTTSRRIPVNTAAGRIELMLRDDGQVTVDMGLPVFDPASLDFDIDRVDLPGSPEIQDDGSWCMDIDGEPHRFGIASIGNPHITLFVGDVDVAPVLTLGQHLESHPRFKQRVNVGFLQIVSSDFARLRVFERGVGETQACGTGACAAMAIARRLGLLESTATLALSGGELQISWPGEGSHIEMTGPCSTVFEGRMRM